LVPLVEPDPAVFRKRQQVRLVHLMKRRVLLQKVCDAMADGCGFHRTLHYDATTFLFVTACGSSQGKYPIGIDEAIKRS
jgi:hypothetical protein